jgi:hypothetical protein
MASTAPHPAGSLAAGPHWFQQGGSRGGQDLAEPGLGQHSVSPRAHLADPVSPCEVTRTGTALMPGSAAHPVRLVATEPPRFQQNASQFRQPGAECRLGGYGVYAGADAADAESA